MRRRVLMVQALGGMRGPARTLALLVPGIARDWDVDVAAPDGFLLAESAQVHSVRTHPLPSGRSRAGSWLGGSRSLDDYISRGPRPDLVHANGLSALNLVAPAALRLGIPVFVHFHGSETGRRAQLLTKLWRRLGLRMSVHPVSEQAREVLRASGIGSVGSNLPNPVAIVPRVERHSGGRDVRVGFVGSASPIKGLDVLVDIAVRLRALPIRWLIIGIRSDDDSTYVERCRERLAGAGVSSRVEWAGVVRDIATAYRQMDVLLVPSIRESWCRVAMEGMAAGLPVVGSDIVGMDELFARVPDALTFPLDRPDLGAQHVRRLVEDPALRDTVGRGGREAMMAFATDVVTSRLLLLYERLVSRVDIRAHTP